MDAVVDVPNLTFPSLATLPPPHMSHTLVDVTFPKQFAYFALHSSSFSRKVAQAAFTQRAPCFLRGNGRRREATLYMPPSAVTDFGRVYARVKRGKLLPSLERRLTTTTTTTTTVVMMTMMRMSG